MTDPHGIDIDEPRPCSECSKPCTRIDIDFEVALHYYPCRTKTWSNYALALYNHKTSVEGDHFSGWSWMCTCGRSASGFDSDGDCWHGAQQHKQQNGGNDGHS